MKRNRRIVVVSEDLAEPWDEGIKKLTFQLARELAKENELLLLNVDRSGVNGGTAVRIPGTRSFMNRELYSRIRAHRPDGVLYVPSPSNTIWSYLRCGVLRRLAPGARIGMIALIPREHRGWTRRVVRTLAPDMTWVPSYRSLLRLSRLSTPGEVLPVGVDLGEFRPPGEGEKLELRKRYGVEADAFVCLHVGHLSRKRNVGTLRALTAHAEVVVIGSTSTPEDVSLRSDLEAAGVTVIRKKVDVADYYRLADCYVFPVEDHEGCVELPLSVIEALACGLPVVSTPFGGLRDFFIEDKDFAYWSTIEELSQAVAALRKEGPPKIRSVSEFGWSVIAKRILDRLAP